MLKQIIEFLRDILRSPTTYDTLESYIVAGNPQNSADVDRLEREFYAKRLNIFEKYY